MEPKKRISRARVWQKEWESMPWDNTRRTVATETVDPTFEAQTTKLNNKRCSRMEKYRGYQVYYYGSEKEKEVRRSQLRDQLKTQLEQIEDPRLVFAKNIEESQKLAEEEKQKTLQDKESDAEKRIFLSKFRDENKMLIEEHAAQRKAERRAERDADKQRMENNPINWSHSLW